MSFRSWSRPRPPQKSAEDRVSRARTALACHNVREGRVALAAAAARRRLAVAAGPWTISARVSHLILRDVGRAIRFGPTLFRGGSSG
jgi:hypothetical protein